MTHLAKLLALGLLSCALPLVPVAADPGGERTVPRVEDPLCPGVLGLQVGPAVQLIDRIRANAERFGIALADPETCQPNLLVAFVDDGRASLEQLMKSQPALFDSLTLEDRRALLASEAPVRAWNIVATRTRDGMMVTRREGLDTLPRATLMAAHSKIYTATRQDIVSSVVLFDSARTKGMTTAQLADYASLRAFAAEFGAYENSDRASILALFDAAAGGPDGLTEADLAFLGTLYSGIPNLPAATKERQLELAVGG